MKKGKKQQYTVETKLEAMRLFLEEGVTQREIAERLGIRSGRNIEPWLRIYRREGEAGLKPKRKGRPHKREDQEAYIKYLEMENALLKKFHSDMRKQRLAKRDIGSSSTIEEHTQ